MSLLQDALSDVGVSVEEFQQIPIDAEVGVPIIPPAVVDQPSASIPVAEVVPEPIVEEPIMVPTVPIEALIETVEPCIDNVVAEHTLLQDKADQLIAMQTAMERYHTIVRKGGFKGITGQTAEAIQVHIQLAQSVLGHQTQIGSMENFDVKGPEQQNDLAVITLESIKEMAGKASDAFVEVIKKILNYLKRLGQNILDGLVQTERALEQLDKELNATKVIGGEGDVVVDTSMFGDDGEIARGAPPKILMLAQFTVVDYPARVAKFFDDAAKVVSAINKDSDDFTEVLERLESATRPLADIIQTITKEDTLPGAYVLDVSENGFSYGIKANGERTGHQEIPLSTTKELRDQVRRLKMLMDTLKKIRPSSEKISTSGEKLLQAASKVGNDEITSKAADYIQQANPRIGEVIDYLVKYTKAQCVAIKVQLAKNIKNNK